MVFKHIVLILKIFQYNNNNNNNIFNVYNLFGRLTFTNYNFDIFTETLEYKKCFAIFEMSTKIYLTICNLIILLHIFTYYTR